MLVLQDSRLVRPGVRPGSSSSRSNSSRMAMISDRSVSITRARGVNLGAGESCPGNEIWTGMSSCDGCEVWTDMASSAGEEASGGRAVLVAINGRSGWVDIDVSRNMAQLSERVVAAATAPVLLKLCLHGACSVAELLGMKRRRGHCATWSAGECRAL